MATAIEIHRVERSLELHVNRDVHDIVGASGPPDLHEPDARFAVTVPREDGHRECNRGDRNAR